VRATAIRTVENLHEELKYPVLAVDGVYAALQRLRLAQDLLHLRSDLVHAVGCVFGSRVDVFGRLMARSNHVVHADDRLVHHALGAVSDVLGAAG
jgi:hypothetical protein